MIDFGGLSWFLDIQVTEGKDAVLLSQSTHVSRLLERLCTSDCKPIKTPIAMNFKKQLQ
jgi:hypothetical protein